MCSCAPLVIEESIGGNWQRWYQHVLVVPDLWSVYTYLISLFIGRQQQRLGYNSKIAPVNSLPFHGDNGAIFRGQFWANSIMIEILSNFAVIYAQKHHAYCAQEKIVIPVDNMSTSNQPKKVCGFISLSVNGRSKNAYVKAQSPDFKCHHKFLWWGKWCKGQLRMNLKVNSVVNAYWHYRRNHCLQTLFLLFECVTRETRESFASRTYALLARTLVSIGDVSLSVAIARMHYVTVCVSP